MAFDPTSLMLAGMAYLLWKGGGGGKIAKPSRAPWPGSKVAPAYGTPEHPWPEAPAYLQPQAATASHEAPAPEPGSDMPMMQKGIPGVSRFARAAVEQMKREQEAREFGSGSGTGTRVYRPKRRGLTQTNIAHAKELVPGWQEGASWSDASDPSVKYVAARHGKKRAIEVWTSDSDQW